MTRQKIQIKKIDNPTARQVTFSKRRRGLFKKAQELATLCDAEVGAVVFSTTGRLFEYSSSSMKQVIERRSLYSGNLNKLDQPSLELQLESSTHAMLAKEITERTRELRQMKGEDLFGLNLGQLQQLEKSLEGGLRRVAEAKDEKILKEVDALRIEGEQLMVKNLRLKELVRHLKENGATHPHHFRRHSLDSLENSTDNDTLDTCLKLGLPFPG